MVIRVGLEPTTPSLRGSCSNQLSYRTIIGWDGRRSLPDQLYYYTTLLGEIQDFYFADISDMIEVIRGRKI